MHTNVTLKPTKWRQIEVLLKKAYQGKPNKARFELFQESENPRSATR